MKKPAKITREMIETMKRLRAEGRPVDEIARVVRVGTGTVSNYTKTGVDGESYSEERFEDTEMSEDQPRTSFVEDVAKGTAVLVHKTDTIIETYEDALRAANVDLTTWFVERWEKKTWTTPMRIRGGQGEDGRHLRDQPIQTQQHGVKLFLRRIVSAGVKQIIDKLYENMQKYSPRYPQLPQVRRSGEPIMAIFGLFDAHFGKLAWQPETGENYDLKIAEQLYKNAVIDLIAESQNRNVTNIILPIGNDFFHMDNKNNTTVNGTPQDVDGRYIKIFEVGCQAVIWAVEQLAVVAPVHVVWVPGNHDPTISYHLAKTIEAWFRNTKRVTVDSGPTTRKYVRWGANLIGFTHGNEEKHTDLPDIMANERSMDWAESTGSREWMVGHLHTSRAYTTKSHDQKRSTIIRILRSLAGTDSWHYKKAYICGDRAAEVYFYGEKSGYRGHAIVSAREAPTSVS